MKFGYQIKLLIAWPFSFFNDNQTSESEISIFLISCYIERYKKFSKKKAQEYFQQNNEDEKAKSSHISLSFSQSLNYLFLSYF